MTGSRRTILIVINLLVIVVAFVIAGLLTLKSVMVPSPGSHEQIVAKVGQISDPIRLRSIIARDDEYIRSLEVLRGQFDVGMRGVLVLMAVFATLSYVLLVLPPSLPTEKELVDPRETLR